MSIPSVRRDCLARPALVTPHRQFAPLGARQARHAWSRRARSRLQEPKRGNGSGPGAARPRPRRGSSDSPAGLPRSLVPPAGPDACSQAGLVNNLNDALAWPLYRPRLPHTDSRRLRCRLPRRPRTHRRRLPLLARHGLRCRWRTCGHRGQRHRVGRSDRDRRRADCDLRAVGSRRPACANATARARRGLTRGQAAVRPASPPHAKPGSHQSRQ